MNRVIVVGGGASGLVSAIVAARNGAVVTILERASTCGKKILATGNGKCNYYNEDMSVKHYNSNDRYLLDRIINSKNKELVLDFFQSIGIVPRVRDGYYYPYSNQAVSVLNALLLEVKRLGISIVNDCYVTDIEQNGKGFVVHSNICDYKTDKLILATGSYAYYNFDNINSYDIVANFNHSIVDVFPALVQLVVDNKITKKWAGVRVFSRIKLYQDNEFIREEEGELMLTNYGISGICAMQLSSIIARGISNNKKYSLVINFVPTLASDVSSMILFLDDYDKKCSGRTVVEILDNILNYKLSNVIALDLGNRYYSDLSEKDKAKLASKLVSFRVDINGTKLFRDAQVCSGGVSIKEINLLTMESLIVKNLYIVGEVLDVDGDCGGYNLGFAWTTGIIAGNSVVNEND